MSRKNILIIKPKFCVFVYCWGAYKSFVLTDYYRNIKYTDNKIPVFPSTCLGEDFVNEIVTIVLSVEADFTHLLL